MKTYSQLIGAGLAMALVACSHALAPSQLATVWPNEPAGMTVLTDWGLEQEPPDAGDAGIVGSPGWRIVKAGGFAGAEGRLQLSKDTSARQSPPFVYEMIYPEGMVEGRAPATVYYAPLNAREVYAGFWWKTSTPFDLGPNGTKIAFLFNGGGDRGGQQFLALLPDRRLHVTTEYPDDTRVRRANAQNDRVALGEWHQIEWYSNLTTGILKWWMDGVLIGSHDDVTNKVSFDMFQFSPTFGGNTGARKQQTDRYWFDHVRLSVRR
jgi:hypothetical protein